MERRQTLASSVSLEGVGLHSGRRIRMTLVPAEAGTGIRFVRTDAGGVEIPATLAHAAPSFYATVIGSGGTSVGTIEHLMAALSALLVDDLRIELDGPEVPILDGSSKPFVDLILDAGRVELASRREYLTLVRPISISLENKRIAAYPCGEYRVTYAIDFDHPLLGYQELSVSLWGDDSFANKLAPARTFTFERDVEALRARGLAKGGSLENAIVLGDEQLLNSTELRFDDEFVRHKILDLTGDLSLLGYALRAHVVAYRAGHDLHSQLARVIWDTKDSWYLAPWSERAPRRDRAVRA